MCLYYINTKIDRILVLICICSYISILVSLIVINICWNSVNIYMYLCLCSYRCVSTCTHILTYVHTFAFETSACLSLYQFDYQSSHSYIILYLFIYLYIYTCIYPEIVKFTLFSHEMYENRGFFFNLISTISYLLL